MTDEDKWKQRFQLFAILRLLGLATFIAGVFIAFTDVTRVGGDRLMGSTLAIVGALTAVLAPRLLKRSFDRQDGVQ